MVWVWCGNITFASPSQINCRCHLRCATQFPQFLQHVTAQYSDVNNGHGGASAWEMPGRMGDGKKRRMVMDSAGLWLWFVRFMALICSTLCPSNYSNGLLASTEVGVWEWRWETEVFVSMCSLDSIRAFRWAMFLGDGSILKTLCSDSMLEGVQPRF